MSKYIINGKQYNCNLSEAKDVALYDNDNCRKIYIAGNHDRHWRYDGVTWFLALGGVND